MGPNDYTANTANTAYANTGYDNDLDNDDANTGYDNDLDNDDANTGYDGDLNNGRNDRGVDRNRNRDGFANVDGDLYGERDDYVDVNSDGIDDNTGKNFDRDSTHLADVDEYTDKNKDGHRGKTRGEGARPGRNENRELNKDRHDDYYGDPNIGRHDGHIDYDGDIADVDGDGNPNNGRIADVDGDGDLNNGRNDRGVDSNRNRDGFADVDGHNRNRDGFTDVDGDGDGNPNNGRLAR